MNDSCKLSAVIEFRSHTAYEQQSNIDVYYCSTKWRLSATLHSHVNGRRTHTCYIPIFTPQINNTNFKMVSITKLQEQYFQGMTNTFCAFNIQGLTEDCD